jgi:hypothetical protein
MELSDLQTKIKNYLYNNDIDFYSPLLYAGFPSFNVNTDYIKHFIFCIANQCKIKIDQQDLFNYVTYVEQKEIKSYAFTDHYFNAY